MKSILLPSKPRIIDSPALASITQLPSDVLFSQLVYLGPLDLVDLALSSKRLILVTHEWLQDHQTVVRRYGLITVSEIECVTLSEEWSLSITGADHGSR